MTSVRMVHFHSKQHSQVLLARTEQEWALSCFALLKHCFATGEYDYLQGGDTYEQINTIVQSNDSDGIEVDEHDHTVPETWLLLQEAAKEYSVQMIDVEAPEGSDYQPDVITEKYEDTPETRVILLERYFTQEGDGPLVFDATGNETLAQSSLDILEEVLQQENYRPQEDPSKHFSQENKDILAMTQEQFNALPTSIANPLRKKQQSLQKMLVQEDDEQLFFDRVYKAVGEQDTTSTVNGDPLAWHLLQEYADMHWSGSGNEAFAIALKTF